MVYLHAVEEVCGMNQCMFDNIVLTPHVYYPGFLYLVNNISTWSWLVDTEDNQHNRGQRVSMSSYSGDN